MEFNLSDHAKEQSKDRVIPINMVFNVAKNPGQKYNNDINETVCQSKVVFGEKPYLLRIFLISLKNHLSLSVYIVPERPKNIGESE